MRRALSYLVTAGLIATGGPAAAIIVAPACVASDGTQYFTADPLAGDWVVAYGNTSTSEVTTLATCGALQQLQVFYSGTAVSPRFYRQEMTDAVNSSQVFTLRQLADDYNADPNVTATISTIPADLCGCLKEGL